MAEQVEPANARIVAASVLVINSRERSNACGSGTIIHLDVERKYAVVLTCKHVFSDGVGKIWVVLPNDSKSHEATWIGSDDRADLAALAINATADTPWVPVADVMPKRGEAIWQVGYPHSQGPKTRTGKARGEAGQNWLADLQVQSGDSGSGIFGADGAVAAVVWGSDWPNGQTTYATSCDKIRKFLRDKCGRWLKPVKPPPKAPPKKAPDPLPPSKVEPHYPPAPAPDFSPVLGRLEKIHALLDAVRQDGAGRGGKLDKTEGLLGRLREDLEGVKGIGGNLGDRLGKAEGLLGRVHGGLEDLRKVEDKVGGIRDRLEALTPVATEAPKLLGDLLGWMPWIVGGVATSGISPLLMVGLWGARAFLRRRESGTRRHVTTIPDAPAAKSPEERPSVPEKVVIVENPPPPQVIRHERDYVPYEKPNGELEALRQAMEIYIRENPGGIGAVKFIEGLAKQIQGGQTK